MNGIAIIIGNAASMWPTDSAIATLTRSPSASIPTNINAAGKGTTLGLQSKAAMNDTTEIVYGTMNRGVPVDQTL